MKAQELRIGNYVKINNEVWYEFKDKPMQVTGISEYKDESFPNSQHTVNLKYFNLSFGQFEEFIDPIEITDEWLERFGFKMLNFDSYDHDGYIILYLQCGFFKFCLDLSNNFSTVEGKGLPVIKYVHQLQNLFFAITGHELHVAQHIK